MTAKVVSIISRMNVGGPAVLISELVDHLPADDFSHILITGVCQNNEIDFLDSHQLNSEIIYISDVGRSLLPMADLKSFIILVKLLKQIKPQIVHTHTSKAGVLGRIAVKIAFPRAQVVDTYHGHLLYGYFPRWKTNLIVKLERFLARITTRYIAVTGQVKMDLSRVGIGPDEKWRVIHPGVRPATTLSKRESRRIIGVPEDKVIISWIGRFTDIKNPMLAIRVVEAIEDKSGLHFVMAGAGELLYECKAYAQERNLPVTFLGWVTDVNPVLSASDLLFMTSRNEGMPVVIVESALKGVPLVTTNVGGVAEFVSNGVTGWLVDQDVEEISLKVSELANGAELIKSVGLNAKKLAENDFSVSKFVEEHVKLYREILQ